MYADLNVPWTSAPQAELQASKQLKFLEILGYDIVALNVLASSVKTAKNVLATSLTSDVQRRLQAQFPKLRILRRVTLVLDDTSSHPNVSQLCAEPDAVDIIAVLPRTEKHLQSCAVSLDIDLICIDTTGRLPFPLRHKLVGSAIKRGVKFEVCYSTERPLQLRHVIANTAMLVRAARNRGIVVSSGAQNEAGIRAPLDVANLLNIWGFSAGSARDSVSKMALEAATQGVLRSRSAKQVVVEPPSKRQRVQ